MKKIIFFDIDGVLNSVEWNKANKKEAVDPACIGRLNRLAEETGAQLVMASSWKLSFPGACSHLKTRGLMDVMDKTPNFVMDFWRVDKSRGAEVNQWLRDNRNKWDRFVIIDDSRDYTYELSLHAVFTDNQVGLTDEDVEKAKEILSKNVTYETE